jgi:ribosomal protein S15P/S13E
MPRAKKLVKEKKEEKVKIKLSEIEFDKKVVELAEKGMTAEKIGETLRREGIHPKEHKKISKVLREKNLYVIPDIKNIETKLENISKHAGKNKQDKRAMRDRERISATLRRAKKYFKQ